MKAIGRFVAGLVKRAILVAVLSTVAAAMVIVLDAMLLKDAKRDHG